MRYTVPGVPPGPARGATAFLPGLTRAACSGWQAFKQTVTGQPGTQGIPALTHATQMHPDAGDLAQAGTSRSSDAPQVWYPSLYYQRAPLEYPSPARPILLIDPADTSANSLLPVPARDARTGLLGGQFMTSTGPGRKTGSLRQLAAVPRGLFDWRSSGG